MNKTEKMLRSLSKSDMDYRDILDIDLFDEERYSDESVTVKKYGTERYKRPVFRFIPVLLFSFIILGGAGLYIVNLSSIKPLVNNSPSEASYASEDNSCKASSEPVKEDEENKFVSIFPEIEVPETMKFRMSKNMRTGADYEYIISSAETCSEIFDILSGSCVEKSEKIKVSLYGSEVILDEEDGEYPYYYSYDDGDKVIRFGQIKLMLPDDTELTVLNCSAFDISSDDFMLVRINNTVTYYRLKGKAYGKILAITEDIASTEYKEELDFSLSDNKGNIPVSDTVPKSVTERTFNYLFSFDLSGTEYGNIPCGRYNASVQNIYALDKNDEFKEIPTKNFKTAVYEENGKRVLNILVIAETMTAEDPGYDLTGCTLKGSFDGIALTDFETGKENYEYSYPLKFDFSWQVHR